MKPTLLFNVRFLNVILCFSVWCCVVSAAFHIAVLGDRTGQADQAVFESIVREITTLHPDAVINVGDLIEGPQPDAQAISAQWDIVSETLKLIRVPFYCVPGNNDIFSKTSRKIYPERSGFKPYYSFDLFHVHFVVLDNSEAKNYDEMGADQLEWLTTDLAQQDPSALICVFYHKPFWYDNFENNKPDKYHEIFRKYGVDWVFSGHFHSYVSTIKDGIHYVMVGSSGGHIGDNPARGEFYQFGWFTIDESVADFCLLRAGSVLPMDFLTLDTRIRQDKIEDDFVSMSCVDLTGRKQGNGKFTLNPLPILENKLQGKYQWHFERTGWDIQPAYGMYDASENNEIAFRITLNGSIYPLPRLELHCSMKDGEYPLFRRLRIRRTLNVPFSTGHPGIVPDGKFTEAGWETAAAIADFGDGKGGIPVVEETKGHVWANATHLFLGFEAADSAPDTIETLGKKRDDPVFQGDCIYVLLWNNSDPGTMVEIIANPDGVFRDVKGSAPKSDSERPDLESKWNGDIRIGTRRDSTGWFLEMSIPFHDLGLNSLHDGSTLTCNFIRFQPRVQSISVWQWPATFYGKEAARMVLFGMEAPIRNLGYIE